MSTPSVKAKANDMLHAPRDGTRILIRTALHMFTEQGFAEIGSQWIEAWFVDGRFQEWCGTPELRTLRALHPIEWTHLPYEPLH